MTCAFVRCVGPVRSRRRRQPAASAPHQQAAQAAEGKVLPQADAAARGGGDEGRPAGARDEVTRAVRLQVLQGGQVHEGERAGKPGRVGGSARKRVVVGEKVR